MARNQRNGFSLVELLLVLGLIGIISMIAIPSFLGQRRRARMIGDAKANAQILAMALETRRADLGLYGSANFTATWPYNTAPTSAATAFLPGFTPKGNSKMNFQVQVGSTGATYVISAFDPSISTTAPVLTQNQSGSVWVKY